MSSFWSLQLLVQDGFAAPQQHSILDLVRGSGLVVQAILYLLVLFSVVSWGIIAQKFRQVRRAKRESEKFIEIFWERRNLSSIHDASRELTASPVGQVFRSGYEELVRVSRSKKESSPGDNLTTELGGVENVSRAIARFLPPPQVRRPSSDYSAPFGGSWMRSGGSASPIRRASKR